MRRIGASIVFFFGGLAIMLAAAAGVFATIFDVIRQEFREASTIAYRATERLEAEPTPALDEQMSVGEGSVVDIGPRRLARHLPELFEKPGTRIRFDEGGAL